MLNKVHWSDVEKFEMILKRVHMATQISNEMMKKKKIVSSLIGAT